MFLRITCRDRPSVWSTLVPQAGTPPTFSIFDVTKKMQKIKSIDEVRKHLNLKLQPTSHVLYKSNSRHFSEMPEILNCRNSNMNHIGWVMKIFLDLKVCLGDWQCLVWCQQAVHWQSHATYGQHSERRNFERRTFPTTTGQSGRHHLSCNILDNVAWKYYQVCPGLLFEFLMILN